ncbi:MAG: hypothetical protein KKH01_07280 [Firmicutes bacterium]|nr:hypothetical protein [Bacillota bacterium]
MRKTNVFGRKVHRAKLLYLVFFVFVAVIALNYTIIQIQTSQLEELQQQEIILQDQIDNLLETSQLETYHEVSQIIQYLPNTYNQLGIINEIGFVRNLSGLALATNFSLNFDESTDSPFEEDLVSTVTFTKITLSMTIDNPTLIFDFIDNLLAQDRIYYIDALEVTYTTDDKAMIQMTIYTFYNDVLIS